MTRALSCDDADLLLAAHAVTDLPAEEHAALRDHLRSCVSCRQAGAAYLRAGDLLPLAVDDVEPPASLRSRILAAVHEDVAGARRPQRLRLLRRLWQGIPSGRGLTLAGAAGSAAAAALALVLILRSAGGGQPAETARVFQACGLTASPTACATVRYEPTARLATMTVTGLAPLPDVDGRPGGTYEVWLVRADRSVVAAAYLTRSPDGSFWSGAMRGDMSEFVAVATTREPAGGSPTPTGAEVLRVDLTEHG